MYNQDSGTPHNSPFEAIRKVTEDGSEYWSARDLSKILGYTLWQKFRNVIEKAQIACTKSDQKADNHFIHMDKMVKIGSSAQRGIEDYQLSRYACYLIVQNADPTKPIVALGQTYFAFQTRRKELDDELANLSEDQLRLVRRSQMSVLNVQLAEVAQNAGVIQSTDFAIFQDHGYIGLYNGLRAKDIRTRKGLKRSQEILDWMNSDELAANAFRASLTRQKLEREQVKRKDQANQAHKEMGQIVRKAIGEAGGIMPENMPTPAKSIQQVQQEEQKQLEQKQQPSLFDDLIDDK